MQYRLKLQLIAAPFVILPVLAAGLLYSTIMKDRLLVLRYDILSFQIESLYRQADREYETLRELGLEETDFFRERARSSIRNFADSIVGPGDILLTENLESLDPILQSPVNDGNGNLIEDFRAGFLPEPDEAHVALIRRFAPLELVLVAATPEYVVYGPILTTSRYFAALSVFSILVFLVILYATFNRFLRPLTILSGLAVRMASGDLSVRAEPSTRDEVGTLAENFNNMARELELLTRDLSSRVDRRTAELQKSLEELKETQEQLIVSEKMAALGSLVAGISHEINTPVGIGVTAMSFMKREAMETADALNRGEIPEATFEEFVESAAETAEIALNAMNRAAELVASFKQAAVDQHSEEKRPFAMATHVQGILTTLKPKLKKSIVEVTLDYSEDRIISSYPGALWQIISNLVLNSVYHAFTDGNPGLITISIDYPEDDVLMVISDNGCGIDDVVKGSIFDPFYTTRRNEGGTGLGLHIVFNLVHQLLKGQIICDSAPGKGTDFRIRFPVDRI